MSRGSSETFGQRLRRLRLEQGKTLRDLASAPPSFQYVGLIETGKRKPSVKIIRTLAAKLRVDPVYLETGEEPPAAELARLVIRLGDGPLPPRAQELAARVLHVGW